MTMSALGGRLPPPTGPGPVINRPPQPEKGVRHSRHRSPHCKEQVREVGQGLKGRITVNV